jgi:hypothetical protein
MGCNCGKNKVSSKSNKVVKQPLKSRPVSKTNNTLKRIIRRSAY